MQFGIALPHFSSLGTRDTVVEVARQAEASGYDSIWTTDHVMMTKGQEEPYGHILEALTTLTYVAALTERIKLGVSVLVFPQREPVLVAKQTATLDVLSGGRLILGVGAGWNEREFRYLSADFGNRGRRLDEYIQALRVLWTSPETGFEGEYLSVSEALFSPRSPQPGGPAIVIGGASLAALRRAARLADGWHATGLPVERFADGMARIHKLAEGRRVEGSIRLRTGLGRELPESRGANGQVQATLSGSVEAIVRRIDEYREAGVEHLVVYFVADDARGFLDDMRRFAGEVRPAFAA